MTTQQPNVRHAVSGSQSASAWWRMPRPERMRWGAAAVILAVAVWAGCRQGGTAEPPPASPDHQQAPPQSVQMGGAKSVTTFFITSRGMGKGGDLGGLAGADAHCQALAAAEGAGDHTWRAYLSTSAADGQPAVNARDRIGKGPWYNSAGELIAANLDELHARRRASTRSWR